MLKSLAVPSVLALCSQLSAAQEEADSGGPTPARGADSARLVLRAAADTMRAAEDAVKLLVRPPLKCRRDDQTDLWPPVAGVLGSWLCGDLSLVIAAQTGRLVGTWGRVHGTHGARPEPGLREGLLHRFRRIER